MAFPADWDCKCALVIQSSKVDADLLDFPVLLTKDTLPSEMFDHTSDNHALEGGGDIRFSSDEAGNTQLACEVVSFSLDDADNEAEIWVKIPSVASETNTTFYIWYDKTGETQLAIDATYGAENVWDSAFKMVQHMKDRECTNYGSSLSGFGDSITAGLQASDAQHRFLNLVANNSKIAPKYWSIDNQGANGKEAADIAASYVYPDSVATLGKSLGLMGYNDMRHWGTDATAETEFEKILYVIAAWNSIPHANKKTGQGSGMTCSGTWANTSVYGGALSKYASTQNDYVEFTVSGTVVYIGLTALYTSGGSYSITVDTVEKATGNCTFTKAPVSGLTYTPFLERIAGLSDSNHTVRVTVTSATGNVYFDWAAGNENTTNFFLGNCLHMNNYTVVGAPWASGSDTAVDQYNATISGVASTLLDDGLKVHYVDADVYYNLSTDVGADGIHPNDSGHGHIADAFIDTIDISTLTQETIYCMIDSTSNNNDGTKKGANEPVEATGLIGEGQNFDGNNDYININSVISNISSDTTGTISFLIKMNDVTNKNIPVYFGDTNADERLGGVTSENGKFRILASDAGTWAWMLDTDNIVFSNGVWAHVFIVQDGVEPVIYLNREKPPQTFISDASKTSWFNELTGLDNGRIGDRNFNSGGEEYSFNGVIDEVRISNTARSVPWIGASHNNQSSPGTFVIEGTPASPGGSNIKSFNSILWENIKSINNIPIALIKSINNITCC